MSTRGRQFVPSKPIEAKQRDLEAKEHEKGNTHQEQLLETYDLKVNEEASVGVAIEFGALRGAFEQPGGAGEGDSED